MGPGGILYVLYVYSMFVLENEYLCEIYFYLLMLFCNLFTTTPPSCCFYSAVCKIRNNNNKNKNWFYFILLKWKPRDEEQKTSIRRKIKSYIFLNTKGSWIYTSQVNILVQKVFIPSFVAQCVTLRFCFCKNFEKWKCCYSCHTFSMQNFGRKF